MSRKQPRRSASGASVTATAARRAPSRSIAVHWKRPSRASTHCAQRGVVLYGVRGHRSVRVYCPLHPPRFAEGASDGFQRLPTGSRLSRRVPVLPRSQRQAQRGRLPGSGAGRERCRSPTPSPARASGRARRPTPASPASSGRRSTAAPGLSLMHAIIYDQEESELRGAARVRRARPEHLRAAADGLRHRPAEEALPAQDGARRRDLVPALLRAGRRLRPRRPAHPRGARRRRLGGQRPEGVELGSALLRLGDPGDAPRPEHRQAQGAHVLLRRHEDAGDRAAADQADLRRLRLQRGVPHQRARSPTRSDWARSARAGRCR